MHKRLIEIRDRRKGIPNSASLESTIKITSIIQIADRLVKRSELSGLDVWRAGSGIAHGNRTMVLMILERSKTPQEQSYRVTAPASIVAWMFETCVNHLEHLLKLYEELNAESKGARPPGQ
jgi:hypothetical protein